MVSKSSKYPECTTLCKKMKSWRKRIRKLESSLQNFEIINLSQQIDARRKEHIRKD